jgi:SseB protein N-terminal domain
LVSSILFALYVIGSILGCMAARAPAPALADAVREAAADVARPADLHAAFLGATVYCERGPTPGFRALGPAGAGVVPVFTSPEQLALARGTVAWFSLLGAELLDLLPDGYDLILDIGGATPLRLRPAALHRRLLVEVEREQP